MTSGKSTGKYESSESIPTTLWAVDIHGGHGNRATHPLHPSQCTVHRALLVRCMLGSMQQNASYEVSHSKGISAQASFAAP